MKVTLINLVALIGSSATAAYAHEDPSQHAVLRGAEADSKKDPTVRDDDADAFLAYTKEKNLPTSLSEFAKSVSDPPGKQYIRVGSGYCEDENNQYYPRVEYSKVWSDEACKAKCSKFESYEGIVGLAEVNGSGWCECLFEQNKLPSPCPHGAKCVTDRKRGGVYTGKGPIKSTYPTSNDWECYKIE